MKKLFIAFTIAALAVACDNSNTTNEFSDNVNDEDSLVNQWDHTDTYTVEGTAENKKRTFDNVSSDLSRKVNELRNQNIDEDIIEKLDEANEKIADAKEKIVKADQKSIEGNDEDANEKIGDAWEKLEEAREKYMEAIEKLKEH